VDERTVDSMADSDGERPEGHEPSGRRGPPALGEVSEAGAGEDDE
jgi:hypothetical protein